MSPVYYFVMWFPEWLRFPVAIAMLASVVPIAGLITFGNWRQAKAYTLVWLKIVGGMIVVGCVIALLFL
jgi:hypothetical protein